MNSFDVALCSCGGFPKLLMRTSATYDLDLNNGDPVFATEFAIQCPDCKETSRWVEKSEGGLQTAIAFWNEALWFDEAHVFG